MRFPIMSFRKVVLAGFVPAAMIACGGSDPVSPTAPGGPGATTPDATAAAQAAPSAGKNRPPHVQSVNLQPREPMRGEPLNVVVRAMDPDGDSFHFDVEWFRNGRSAQKGPGMSFQGQDLRRGDRVYAIVKVSDGLNTVTQRTDEVQFKNSLPRVQSVRMLPVEPTGGTRSRCRSMRSTRTAIPSSSTTSGAATTRRSRTRRRRRWSRAR